MELSGDVELNKKTLCSSIKGIKLKLSENVEVRVALY
jgi:hypothetical protein